MVENHIKKLEKSSHRLRKSRFLIPRILLYWSGGQIRSGPHLCFPYICLLFIQTIQDRKWEEQSPSTNYSGHGKWVRQFSFNFCLFPLFLCLTFRICWKNFYYPSRRHEKYKKSTGHANQTTKVFTIFRHSGKFGGDHHAMAEALQEKYTEYSQTQFFFCIINFPVSYMSYMILVVQLGWKTKRFSAPSLEELDWQLAFYESWYGCSNISMSLGNCNQTFQNAV